MSENWWQPEKTDQLTAAVERMERELPGWWWSTGSCSVSAHASIGPDIGGTDSHLLPLDVVDEGFHADLAQPATCAEALNRCIDQALYEKREIALSKQ